MSRTDKSSGNQSGRQGGGQRKKSFSRGNSPIKKQWQKPKPEAKNSGSDEKKAGTRLNKYIANTGTCSRREADIYIASGNVWVNGKPVTEMGYRVMPGDTVKFDGKLISDEKTEYLLLNKPKGFIATQKKDIYKKNVTELVANATKARIQPVGQMDRSNTGLLLFTNDGELTKKLNAVSSKISTLYHIILDKNMTQHDFLKIKEGIKIEDELIVVDEISYIDNAPKNEITVRINSGKSRAIRKIIQHLGYEVSQQDRVLLGQLTKKDLPRGHWRFLTSQEIINLKNMA